jgi:hypothetical protein
MIMPVIAIELTTTNQTRFRSGFISQCILHFSPINSRLVNDAICISLLNKHQCSYLGDNSPVMAAAPASAAAAPLHL